jgi:hypothetical protein
MDGLISGPSKEELQAMDEAIAILKREYVMLFKRLIRVALADLGEVHAKIGKNSEENKTT